MLKLGVAAVLAILAAFAVNRSQLLIGLLAAGGVLVYAARDVLARERLRADRDEIVAVRGYAGRRHIAWPHVEQIRVDSRSRLGGRAEMLELDTGDEIFLFSRFDLGVSPEDAARELQALRPA
jgi:hypothetical protein